MAEESHSDLSYQDVQRALERCMAANPAEGVECRLSKDASLLADILGDMIYRKVESLPASAIAEKRIEVFDRWRYEA
jgi:hypothetical protein